MKRLDSRLGTRPLDTCAQDDGAFFDRLLAEKGESNTLAERGWATLGRCFVQTIRPRSLLRLLDVGCGAGQSRRLYVNHCALYVGLDLSYEGLRRAREKFPGSVWVRGDACLLPFERGSFTVVAFSSVLHHIGDYRVALAEAYGALAPGGQVFAFDPNVFHPAMGLFRHPRSPLYIADGVSPNERPLRPASLRKAFKRAGFTRVQQYCQADLPFKAVAPKLLNACLAAYNLGDRLMDLSGFGRWLGPFVVTAGLKPVFQAATER